MASFAAIYKRQSFIYDACEFPRPVRPTHHLKGTPTGFVSLDSRSFY